MRAAPLEQMPHASRPGPAHSSQSKVALPLGTPAQSLQLLSRLAESLGMQSPHASLEQPTHTPPHTPQSSLISPRGQPVAMHVGGWSLKPVHRASSRLLS